MTARKARPFEWTPKREAFCAEYLVDLCAADAARRAGYSHAAARQRGHELMLRPEVRARIQSRMDKRAAKTEMTAEKTLAEIGRIAHTDLAGIYDENGALKSVHDMPEELRRAIAAIEVDEIYEWEGSGGQRKKVLVGYTKKVKFWNKPDALQLEGRHQKLFTDKVEHDVTDGLADALAQARARAKAR